MIKSIYSVSSHIQATPGVAPYISQNANAGAVRFNTLTQSLEVCDGTSWVNMTNSASVQLSGSAEAAISWAIARMNEEALVRQLADKNATIADALARVEQAKRDLEVLTILVNEGNA